MIDHPTLLRSLRVLIVDDQRDDADSLGLLARAWGHEARAAYEGEAALALEAAFRPEVVLLDLVMPLMDGLEVARRVRAQIGREDVLLVAVTGHASEERWAQARLAGFDCLLLKPVFPAVLRDLLDRQRPQRTRSTAAGT